LIADWSLLDPPPSLSGRRTRRDFSGDLHGRDHDRIPDLSRRQLQVTVMPAFPSLARPFLAALSI